MTGLRGACGLCGPVAGCLGHAAQRLLPDGVRGRQEQLKDLLNSTGMHHDGMHYLLGRQRSEGLLVVSHEYIDEKALHPAGPTMVNSA